MLAFRHPLQLTKSHYNSTLPKVFVYLLTTIEALYQTSVPLEVQNRKGSVAKFSKKSILV